MYLNELYSTNKPEVEKWQKYFLNHEKKEQCFLLLFAPVFAHSENQIQNFITEKIQLKNIINEETIYTYVQNCLTKMIFPVISRACVYEMQYASKYKVLKADTSKGRFDEFISYLTDKNTAFSFLQKYTVLKNIVENVVINFISNSKEWLERLENDFEEICETYGFPKQIFLKKVIMSGDLHNSGKSVSVFEFQDNVGTAYKIVYKPRPLDTDHAFAHLIKWFAKDFPLLSQYHQTNIYKKGYGWCEFIDHLPCLDKGDVHDFYTRMGSILAITHLLCSSDFHIENIIAHGALPFLVDLECILSKPDPHATHQEVSRHSLLSTHILPARVMYTSEYNGVDISGISGDGGEESPYKSLIWKKSGTDEMHLVRESSITQKSKNKPFLVSGEEINPVDYKTVIMQSFEETFLYIQNHKKFLLSQESPLQNFKSCKVRTVLRATSTYGKLLYESYHPTLLNNVEKRLKHFEWLKTVPTVQRLSNSEKILDSELQDLQDENIPYFYCLASQCEIYNSHNIPVSSTQISSFSYITKHLEQYFDKADLDIQLSLIENAFYALHLTQNPHGSKSNLFFARNYEIQYESELSNEIALKIALKHLEHLKKYSIIFSNKAYWPSLENIGKGAWTASTSLHTYDVYNGTAGIMLTFAYAAKIFNNQSYYKILYNSQCVLKEFVQLYMSQLDKNLQSENTHSNIPQFFKQLGFYNGVGGCLYSLFTVTKLFPEFDLAPMINECLSCILKVIKQNRSLDFIGGVAGFIVSLLKIQDVVQEQLFYECLNASINNLLELYPNPQKLSDADSMGVEKPLLGMSHGISGFMVALSGANQILQRNDLKTWIQDALEYENQFYNSEYKNWPDFRIDPSSKEKNSDGNYMMAWCHGAPGVGIARIAMQKHCHDIKCEKDIRRALDSLSHAPIQLPLTLCHSTLGNLDLILLAKENNYISDKEYRNYISDFLSHAQAHDTLMQFDGQCASPGLMMGHAGVAYQMMRIANPESIPSILV